MENKSSTNFRAMGTDVSVEITDLHGLDADLHGQSFLEEVKNIFAKKEKIFSRFNEDSELSKINSNLGKEIEISNEMLEVLELCLKFHEISGGYFDPRVLENLERLGYDKDFRTNNLNRLAAEKIELEKISGELKNDLRLNKEKKTVMIKKRMDTTGIAKGFTVDAAARFLDAAGCENYIVDAGGDMRIKGRDEQGERWRIGIEGLEDGKLMLELGDCGLATSGISRKRWQIGAQKYHHLLNPLAPEKFSHEIKTVTVVADEAVEADGRAKVLVLLGKEKGLEFANKNRLAALWLDYRGNVYLSEAIKKYIFRK